MTTVLVGTVDMTAFSKASNPAGVAMIGVQGDLVINNKVISIMKTDTAANIVVKINAVMEGKVTAIMDTVFAAVSI